MSTARFIVGDALTELRKLPDRSVDLVMTSPPFLALRAYLPVDHAHKAAEIGSESTPGEFIDRLLDVTVECRRVLTDHGSLVVELGDTYAGSGGAGGDYGPDGLRAGQPAFDGSSSRQRAVPLSRNALAPDAAPPARLRTRRQLSGWPLDKSKVLIPQLFAVALSYGFNPLTGREVDPWRVRNVVAWCRPNPSPGEVGDKFRPATTYLTVACTSRTRYFDLHAVRHHNPRSAEVSRTREQMNRGGVGYHTNGDRRAAAQNPAGAPPLDFWVIPTAPYQGSHYATYPPALCVRPVKAMAPERVCLTCGEPSRRILEPTAEYAEALGESVHDHRADEFLGLSFDEVVNAAQYETVGWTDCGHETWRRGVVLDPFAGSGTTLAVATGHGRDAVGIDLDERNADLALERIGPLFLEVVRA